MRIAISGGRAATPAPKAAPQPPQLAVAGGHERPMAEEELEARIRIAMPPLRRLGDLLIMRNVDFDLRAVATSLVRLPKKQQVRVQVQDPAVAGAYWRWGLHGAGYYAALQIIQEGFVGSVRHDRCSKITNSNA